MKKIYRWKSESPYKTCWERKSNSLRKTGRFPEAEVAKAQASQKCRDLKKTQQHLYNYFCILQISEQMVIILRGAAYMPTAFKPVVVQSPGTHSPGRAPGNKALALNLLACTERPYCWWIKSCKIYGMRASWWSWCSFWLSENISTVCQTFLYRSLLRWLALLLG